MLHQENDKMVRSGAFRVFQSVIINLKIKKKLRIINQQHPRFCAIFFSKINPDAHVSTKINTITYYKGGLGAIAPRKPKKCKKWMFFLSM